MKEELTNEIVAITSVIREEFPELYELLDETPLFLSYQEKGLSIVEFKQYLETIKIQLTAFAGSHANA